MLGPDDRTTFATRGVLVLRGAFEPTALSAEVDRALGKGASASSDFVAGQSGAYCPMLGEETPASVALVDRFAPVAAALLGRDVLPVRAKAVAYAGETGWHVDAEGPPVSVGFLAYLEPLDAGSGALRVRPGSHLRGDAAGEEIVATRPGDVIVMDERVAHASFGGRDRRQWRIDYVIDPAPHEEAAVRGYYSAILPPRARPPYDATRYPSYGAGWMASGRPWIATMRRLGVFAAAAEHEAAP